MDQPSFNNGNSLRSYTSMLSNQNMHQQQPYSTQQSSLLSQQLTYNHHQQVPVQPVPIPPKSAHSNTFVHKLYNMVVDTQFQHLITWNYTGESFIVAGITEFAKDVLPKHFKHNNFSSFVRQLNMYGFHKVNKSPRGHRTLAENQIWEFDHKKFLRDRPDLLEDIKRKTMESDTVRRETGDLHTHMAMMQASQSDLLQQINHLYDNFSHIVKELHETKQRQESQYSLIKKVTEYISNQNGGQLPHELSIAYKQLDMKKHDTIETPPSIFVTTHDQQDDTNILQNFYNDHNSQPLVPSQRQQPMQSIDSLAPSTTFKNSLPLSPSPTMLLATSLDDDNNSYYPPKSNISKSPTSSSSSKNSYPFINPTMNG